MSEHYRPSRTERSDIRADDVLRWIEENKKNVGMGGGNLVMAGLVIEQAIREILKGAAVRTEAMIRERKR